MAVDSTVLAQYNGGDLKITAILFLVLTGLSVGLRTYVRAFMTNSFQADDWLMLIAQANFITSCAFILIGVEGYGLGHHNKALPQWEEIEALKWQALATASYITNMMFIKLSIGVFLLRLAVQRRYKWILYISMVVVFLWSTALFFWDIFQCRPVAAQWDYTIPNYTCVSAEEVVTAAYALSVMNILTDWLYALLPVPMIWKVKMTTQAKVTVVTILGLGIFASVATLIRVKFLAQLTDTSDILFAGTDAMVWTLVEPGVAIVASSLVTIRPLLRQMRLKGFESSERSHSRGFWGRGGRSTGGRSDNNNKNNNHKIAGGGASSGFSFGLNSSKGQWAQVPGDHSGDLKLKDLEAGHYPAGGSKSLGGRGGGKLGSKGGVSSSGETTLTSRGSTQTQTKIWTGPGAATSTTLQEEDHSHHHYHHHEYHEQPQDREREADMGNNLGVGIAVTTDPSISPVSSSRSTSHPPFGGHGGLVVSTPFSDSSSESDSVLIIEGATAPSTAPQRSRSDTGSYGGKNTTTTRWRKDERPQSVEASDRIQGLRYPGSAVLAAWRAPNTTTTGEGGGGGDEGSRRFSIQGLPIQR